jgi:flagellar biogenesis protein FliO
MSTLFSQNASLAGDYASGLLQAITALGVVAAFTFLVLRFTALRGALGQRGKLLNIEESLRLDPRNSLLIVRVEQRRLLIATHTDGSARLLAELSRAEPLCAERTASAAPGES